MIATRDGMRVLRALLALGIGLVCASQLAAQDPRASLVQASARAWLANTDRGDAAQSWKSAGKRFQEAITVDRWAESLKRVRPPLGAMTQRAVLATQFRKNFPGAPDGEYAIVVFSTNFAEKLRGEETLVLQREPDSVWRIIGYTIR
ncbi:MAG: DUF4019 domain-containing protein [Betaproteobacteria bacterium]